MWGDKCEHEEELRRGEAAAAKAPASGDAAGVPAPRNRRNRRIRTFRLPPRPAFSTPSPASLVRRCLPTSANNYNSHPARPTTRFRSLVHEASSPSMAPHRAELAARRTSNPSLSFPPDSPDPPRGAPSLAANASAASRRRLPPRSHGVPLAKVAAVLCIGDSYLAGWNAAGYSALHFRLADREYRGASFGCGDGRLLGFPHIATLATILQGWRPALQGMSSGWTPKYGNIERYPTQCGLNAAASGATVMRLYEQAKALVRLVNNSALAKEWKVVTVQAGWGDLAWETGYGTPVFRNWMLALLSLLKAGLGKAYVNVLAVSERGDDFAVHKAPSVCATKYTMWKGWQRRVHNVTFRTGSSQPKAEELNAILHSMHLMSTPGFIVRFQPLLRRYVAGTDNTEPTSCFHPSLQGHETLAWGLFQNMIAPHFGVAKVRDASQVDKAMLRDISDRRDQVTLL
ncbi:hypothetical protein AB1Y20_023180 [Prymnesium parvum]|uniref:SGNH hydrolase-type esterase domain-containing protein n=1 Tax=Prymnesium parvum TaxID=97485 RepID=A0AB34JG85_PRYPA